MNLIDRYIAKVLIFSTFIVLLLFFGVQSFVQFLAELQDIDKNQYGIWQALLYVPLQSINIMYQLFPVAGLIGCLLGLGRLATHSELVVIQAAGVSRLRINFSVIKAVIIMLIVVTLLGEGIGPWASRFAANYKAAALQDAPLTLADSGWVRDGNNFLYIAQVVSPNELREITRYCFADNKLVLASKAQYATLIDQHWVFYNVAQSTFTPTGVELKHIEQQDWQVNFDTKILRIPDLNINEENLCSLYRLIHYMKENNLQSNQLAFNFYQRLLQPLATIVMICLAVPFIFGPLRSSTMGLRMLVGILLGFIFYTFNQFLGPFSMVYQIQPIFSASLPIGVFVMVNALLFYLARR